MAAMEAELKSTVAGLLLHSQLALSGEQILGPAAERLRVVADLAASLRQQLSVPVETRMGVPIGQRARPSSSAPQKSNAPARTDRALSTHA